MKKIIQYFGKKLTLKWPEEHKEEVVVISLLRNCLMHNNGLVDVRLSEVSDFNIGDRIELGVGDVHSYGITARSIARHLHSEARRRHLERDQL